MDKEIEEKQPLPEGFKLRPKVEGRDELPPGFKLRPQSETKLAATAAERDAAIMRKEAGPFQVPDVTPEQLKKMSLSERLEFNEALKNQREHMIGGHFGKQAISTFTFGASENVPGLEVPRYEEWNPYSLSSIEGGFVGSLIPYHYLGKLISIPAAALAAKSPIFQRQISSLLTTFGVGAADEDLHSITKGEMPSAEDVLDNGIWWVELDIALKTLGKAGTFAKWLFTRSRTTGQPRLQIVNQMKEKMAEGGVDMSTPEKVGEAALEIIEGPLSEAEKVASRNLQLAEEIPSEVTGVAAQAIKAQQSPAAVSRQLQLLKEPISEVPGVAGKAIKPHKPQPENARNLQLVKEPVSEVSKTAEEVIKSQQPGQGTQRNLQLTKQPKSEVSKTGEQALKQEQITPTDLKTRKISDEPINRLTSETHVLAEPYEPETLNFTKQAEALENTALTHKMEAVGERATTPQELGNAVREDIESGWKQAKKDLEPLYQKAEAVAGTLKQEARPLARAALNEMIEIKATETQPGAYSGVLKTLEQVIHDAGYVVKRGAGGKIQTLIKARDASVKNIIEVGKRLNEMIDFQEIEPGVQLALGRVVKVAKAEARNGLSVNPEALSNYEHAEKHYAIAASQFSTPKIIRQIRKQEAGEKVAKLLDSPEAMEKIRDILSPAELKRVEREWLERLNKKKYEAAKEDYHNMRKHLSKDARNTGKDIVQSKNPLNDDAKRKLFQDGVLDDMSNALTTGTRPKETLDLWKTPKGRKLVEDSFQGSPSWPEVKRYLEQQSFNDMLESVIKDGKIDLKKFKSFMRDPETVYSIRDLGGQEAVTFFRQLDSQVKQLEQNLHILNHFPTPIEIKKGMELVKKAEREVSNLARGKEFIQKTKSKNEAKPNAIKIGEGELARQREIAEESSKAPFKRGEEFIKQTKAKNEAKPSVIKLGEGELARQREIAEESGKAKFKRGETFIQQTKAKNEAKPEIIKLGEGELQRQRDIVEESGKAKFPRGEAFIQKTKGKNEAKPNAKKIGEKELQRQRDIAKEHKESKGERGKSILRRMAEKDFPAQAKFKKWSEWFKDTMGLKAESFMSVFGLMKLGLPNTVVSLISFRLFNKLLTSQRMRRAFTEAAKQHTNPLQLILAVEKIAEEMDKEEQSDINKHLK